MNNNFVTWLFCLTKDFSSRFSLLVFSLWDFCVLVPHYMICAAHEAPSTCLIWHAVALELSIFFASCLTLLAGRLLSFMVLDTNSSSLRKTQRCHDVKSLAVSGGYLARLTCACTSFYYSPMLLLPCLKLVRRSKWAHTSFVSGL